ncbi:MAG TPA: extracellular solute-binding protein, partial [Candidatus Caenarcaniphilales bacterium]
WGAPYRWGTTMIAYRKDKFKRLGWTPTDWQDLWRPELQRRISLLDQPREVIGLTLKKLGYSYNSDNLLAIANLKPELQALHQQVKLYSSNAYLQPLLLGDTWLAVGWSTDILPTLRQNNLIGAVIPQSGTALWADVWVQPATVAKAPSPAFLNQWIDLWWQPSFTSQLLRLNKGGFPILPEAELSKASRTLLFPDKGSLSHSEFLKPLAASTIDQYRTLWLEIRRA